MPDVTHGDRGLRPALLACCLAALLAGCAASSGDDAAARATTAAATTGPALTTPDRAGEWTRVTTETAQDNAEAYLTRAAEEAEPGVTPLFAEYERADGGTLAYLGFNIDPGSEAGERVATTPQVVVDVALADSGIQDRQALDPGPQGGALACGTLPPEYEVDGLTCAWAGDTTSAQVTVVAPGLDYETAAALTRDFRAAVTDG